MFDIYEDNSLVVVIRKNLYSESLNEGKFICKKIKKCEKQTRDYICVPYVNNSDNLCKTHNIQYGFNDNNELVTIELLINNKYINVVYIMNLDEISNLYEEFQEHFEILCYSPTYEILNDGVETSYDIKIDFSDSLVNKIYFNYNEIGLLQKIVIKNDVDRVFSEVLSNQQLEDLKEHIKKESVKFIITSTENYSKNEGEICFMALEYFYDGQAVDIGLRIGLQKERVDLEKRYPEDYPNKYDVREATGDYKYYKPILDCNEIKSSSENLFQYLKKLDSKNDSNITYYTIKELALNIANTIKSIDWHNYAKVTNDFLLVEANEYN